MLKIRSNRVLPSLVKIFHDFRTLSFPHDLVGGAPGPVRTSSQPAVSRAASRMDARSPPSFVEGPECVAKAVVARGSTGRTLILRRSRSRTWRRWARTLEGWRRAIAVSSARHSSEVAISSPDQLRRTLRTVGSPCKSPRRAEVSRPFTVGGPLEGMSVLAGLRKAPFRPMRRRCPRGFLARGGVDRAVG